MATPEAAMSTATRGARGGLLIFFVVTAASAGGVALYLNLNPARGLVKANGTGQANTARLYTVEELSVHDSTHPRQRLLSILGEVFDVSRKPEVYGAEGGYNFFAGRDATRAFVSGEFKGDALTDRVDGLTNEEALELLQWRDFYHKEYTFMGRLASGQFYDANGDRTATLDTLEANAAVANEQIEREKEQERLIPTCSSRWTQQEGGKVSCTTGYPRKTFVKQLGNKTKFRCACHQHPLYDQERVQLYPDCTPAATWCQTSPPPTQHQKPAPNQ